MVIDINEIEGSGLPFGFSVDAGEIDTETPGCRLIGPTSISGEIEKHIAGVAVKGKINGEIEVDCTRCLDPIRRQLLIGFDVDYLNKGELGVDGEVELKPDDLETDELDGNQLDLAQLAREQILLNIPEQAYCTENCKGLCEQCGANLNLVDCNCGQDEIDPRWEALKSLKESLN